MIRGLLFPRVDRVTTPDRASAPVKRDTSGGEPSGRLFPVPNGAAKTAGGVSVLAVRSAPKGEVKGLRALRAAVGLEGWVPIKHLRLLRRVRSAKKGLSDLPMSALYARFEKTRSRVMEGEALLDALPEAFAVAGEMCRRSLGMTPRDEQLLTAIALVDGSVAELGTGEGKTLAVGLAASLFALQGKGAHVITSNAYLAGRDAEEMEPWFTALGLTVGVVPTEMSPTFYDDKRAAYGADITYGDVNTFAFDWLEDQTWWDKDHRVMRDLHAAIVDEADDVLLDTAQKPLVLSTANETEGTPDPLVLQQAAQIVEGLELGTDVNIYLEGEQPSVKRTDAGNEKVEARVMELFGLSEPSEVWSAEHCDLLAEIDLALEALYAVRRGIEYVRIGDDIVLIDEATGRPNPDGRLRHGLHNAVRAREGLPPEAVPRSIGVGSYQHFFRAYEHLCGTTGSADGTREEFSELYGLRLTRIANHRASMRSDLEDRPFNHPAFRDAAALVDLVQRHAVGQPVLVSTVSVSASKAFARLVDDPRLAILAVAESSKELREAAVDCFGTDDLSQAINADPEALSRYVDWLSEQGLDLRTLLDHLEGVPHQVLNAENHGHEAGIVSQAGGKGAIVIATQMAGRGVDIRVPEDVLELGGLHVLGIGRKTNRRKDVQLVGRSGRRGEIGSSQFFLAPTDPFMAHLSARRRRALAGKLNTDTPEATEPAEKGAYRRAVRGAQKVASMRSQGHRVLVSKLDWSVEKQREAIQAIRETVLSGEAVPGMIEDWMRNVVSEALVVDENGLADHSAIRDALAELDPTWTAVLPKELMSSDEVEDLAIEIMRAKGKALCESRGESERDLYRYAGQTILYHLDRAWIDLMQGQELMRDTALMRTNLNAWSEHTAETTGSFIEMAANVHRAVSSSFAFYLNSQQTNAPQELIQSDA